MKNGESSYRRFIEGDQDAFAEILDKYRSPLTLFIDSFVRDSMVAEDIAIDVFTYVLLHPKAFNGSVQFKTYLYMLGRSRAIDHLRHRKRYPSLSLSETADIAERESLEEQVLQNDRNRRLYEAIKSLPENMRTAVHLVYFEGLSYKETAQVMKRNEKQIDNLLYRAKQALYDALKDGEQLI